MKMTRQAELMAEAANRTAKIIKGEQALFGLEQAIDFLREAISDLTSRSLLIDEFHRLDAEQDKLAAIIEKLKAARERQEAKVIEFSEFLPAAE